MIIKVANQTHHTSNSLIGIINMARYDANYEDIDDFFSEVRQFNVKSEIHEAMKTVIEEEFIPRLTDKIKSKGLYANDVDKGDGPYHLSSEDAWKLRDNTKNMQFIIETKESVADRAYFLEYGTDTVTPSNSDYLKFKPKPSFDGVTDEDGFIYRKEVEGVDEYEFFRETIREFNTSQKVKEEYEGEITDRVENALTLT